MNENLKKLEKSINLDTIMILIFAILLSFSTIANIISIVKYACKDKSAFEVVLQDTDVNHSQEYCLFIDGEEYGTIDYNEYAIYTFDGENDYKTATILDRFRYACDGFLLSAIMLLLFCFFLTAQKKQGPFIRQSVTILRVIGGLCVALALISPLVTLIVRLVTYGYANGSITPQNFFVFLIGLIFFMIAELFKYGVALQEDSNLIA